MVLTASRYLRLLALPLLLLGSASALAEGLDKSRIDAAARTFMERTSAPGLAVGIVTPDGAEVFCYGVASKETGMPVDERTLFEVGSISKTFTVALASYAAETGAIQWDAVPGRYIPELKDSALDRVSLLDSRPTRLGYAPAITRRREDRR